jgi:hypothetical protein
MSILNFSEIDDIFVREDLAKEKYKPDLDAVQRYNRLNG